MNSILSPADESHTPEANSLTKQVYNSNHNYNNGELRNTDQKHGENNAPSTPPVCRTIEYL
jgi:hypothetical protein